jgi:uncharacterized RDD family membrane protein YckC
MSSAQLEPRHELLAEGYAADAASAVEPPDAPLPTTLFALEPLTPFSAADSAAMKQEVAARLAAHRARRQKNAPAAAPAPVAAPGRERAARIAATVAERYAHSESYRSFLAAEANSAIRQAEAAAEVAAVTARAVTEAQLNLLEELDQYSLQSAEVVAQAQPYRYAPDEQGLISSGESIAAQPSAQKQEQRPAQRSEPAGKLTVRLYEDVAPSSARAFKTSHLLPAVDPLDDEGLALDDEIAFRQAPVFLEASPTIEIPANLLEFPRQLVAARKARPRIAEGPLREDADHAPASSQLRIFEVETTQISTEAAMDLVAPEWSSILLDAQPMIAPTMVQAEDYDSFPAPAPLLLTAPLELRIMAAAVDNAIVIGAMLAFAAVAVSTIGSIPTLPLAVPGVEGIKGILASLMQLVPLACTVVGTFLFLTTVYQFLFFTFAEATPGMRYARIGLCTFNDENPTRKQLRRRVPATLLATCPLGLGFIWSWIDSDRLGWHDRISRTYQRSY